MSAAQLVRYKLILVSLLCSSSSLALLGGARAFAQMGQGEAAINVRSDVRLGVKGTGGTPSERLAKLGQAVGDQMGEIRGCYRKLVATAPELAGALQLKLTLPEAAKAKATVEVTKSEGGADELVKCVSKVLRDAPYKDVGRPAAAFLSLEFDNSRAKGQAAMNAKSAELAKTAVQSKGDGTKEGSWTTEGAEVRFTVAVDSGAPDAALELIMRGFKASYAAFLDCRRKCEKGGVSPEGDIEANLDLDKRGGKAKIKLGTITVTHERAPTCGTKAFNRTKFDKPEAPIHARVVVHFAK
ncbi:MAG TPA: hypothetical protein VJR89_24310 [Polyangiales bacterium]|nr:hypothetical protein [Polyangiales bacterium]